MLLSCKRGVLFVGTSIGHHFLSLLLHWYRDWSIFPPWGVNCCDRPNYIPQMLMQALFVLKVYYLDVINIATYACTCKFLHQSIMCHYINFVNVRQGSGELGTMFDQVITPAVA